jgi:Spy/CpxP family protein refolding chaperone
MTRRVRGILIALAAALSGTALAQDAARESGANASRSWADEVRSAIGAGRSDKGSDGGQVGREAPVRSDMQTGSTGKSAPGKPDKR